ncbi:MAG: archaetidylserine decarboxylase [Novosphingobium sp.]|nr:archaetidylserine decarboxylase [Novosphingobium sp.]
MTLRSAALRILMQENVNFLLTNRIPRLMLTRFMGWFSKIENPVVCRVSIALWRFFCDVDLTDAAQSDFRSLHAAFIRRLKPNARPINADPMVLVSPCDAIVGAFGKVTDGQAWQIKGLAYRLAELLADEHDAADFRDGWYVTLRLTAGMYHRFHAPGAMIVERIRYISGDTWNVNPIALKRIERLFCRNERAAIRARLQSGGESIMLVPVAAILVASIRMPRIDPEHGLRKSAKRLIACNHHFAKGEEMGWFEHGSTIIVLAPPRFRPDVALAEGRMIRMGEALLRASDQALDG